MSKHVVSLVYRKKIGSMMRKAVLSYMADRANDDGSGIWCSKATIANEIEASRQGVITTIKGLLSDGLLVEDGKRPCSNGFTIEYRIDLQKLHALPFVTGKNVDGSKSGPVNRMDVAPSTGVTSHVNVVDPNRPEPSLEPSTACVRDAVAKILDLIPANKRRMAPQDSLPKVVKTILRTTPPEQLLDAVRACYAFERHVVEEGQFAPAIYTFLQKGAWKGWLDGGESASPKMDVDAWREAMRKFVDHGTWPAFLGPKPGEEGCRVPDGLLNHWKRIAA